LSKALEYNSPTARNRAAGADGSVIQEHADELEERQK
jgi:hypothetical protein